MSGKRKKKICLDKFLFFSSMSCYCTRDECYLLQPCPKHETCVDLKQQEDTQCPICWCYFSDLITFQPCKHAFCEDCIRHHINEQVTSGNGEVMCPSLSCSVKIPDDDIEHFSNSGCYEYYRYLKSKLAIRESAMCPCCFANCCKWPRNVAIVCQACSVTFCYLCQNQNCAGTCENDCIEIECDDGSTDLTAKRCPRCETWLSLEEGCYSVICNFCKLKFCWQCRHTQAEIDLMKTHHCVGFHRYLTCEFGSGDERE